MDFARIYEFSAPRTKLQCVPKRNQSSEGEKQTLSEGASVSNLASAKVHGRRIDGVGGGRANGAAESS